MPHLPGPEHVSAARNDFEMSLFPGPEHVSAARNNSEMSLSPGPEHVSAARNNSEMSLFPGPAPEWDILEADGYSAQYGPVGVVPL